MPTTHPYSEFENTKLWKIVDAAIDKLEKNGDLKLETQWVYVIGYLCKMLDSNSVATYGVRTGS